MICVWFLCVAGYASAQQPAGRLSGEQKLEKAGQYYAKGKQFIQQGEFARADQEFKKAQQILDDSFQSAPAGTLKAQPTAGVPGDWEAVQKSKPEEIIAFLLHAISLDPENPDLHYNLAIQYIKANNFKEAADALQQVIKTNPQDKDAYYNLGVLYENYLDDIKKARAYYSHYIKFSPFSDDAAQVKTWIRQIDANKKDW
jgi:tetratricopeptide (TPR) repeat protein